MNNQDSNYNFVTPFFSFFKNSPYKEERLNQTPLPNSENRPNNQLSPDYINLMHNSRFVTPKKLDFNNGILFPGNTPMQINNIDYNISPFNSSAKINMSNFKLQNQRKNSFFEFSPFRPMINNNSTPLNKSLFHDKV